MPPPITMTSWSLTSAVPRRPAPAPCIRRTSRASSGPPRPSASRARRGQPRHVDQAEVVTGGDVGVEPPPQAPVELLRAVDVGYGDDDDLELHVGRPWANGRLQSRRVPECCSSSASFVIRRPRAEAVVVETDHGRVLSAHAGAAQRRLHLGVQSRTSEAIAGACRAEVAGSSPVRSRSFIPLASTREAARRRPLAFRLERRCG